MCSGSFLTDLFHGNAIVCSDTFKQYEVNQAVQQQVETLQNTQDYYSDQPLVMQVAQNAADAAIAAAPSDADSIFDDIANSDIGNPILNSSCDGYDFSSVGFGCISKSYIYWIVGIIAAIILLTLLTDARAITGR